MPGYIALTANTSFYAYNFKVNLIRELAALDFKVLVLSPEDDYSSKLQAMENVLWNNITVDNAGMNPIKDFQLMKSLYKVYKTLRPLFIFNNTVKLNIYSTIAGRLLGIPSANNISGLGTLFISSSFSSKLGRSLYIISQALAEKVFFQNTDDQNIFLKYRILKQKRCDLIPGSGVDLVKYTAHDIYKKNKKRSFRFSFIGRLIEDKGIVEFVKAAELLKRRYPKTISFEIIGPLKIKNRTSISEHTLKKWIAQDIVIYRGEQDNIKPYLLDTDCVVLPSYREGVPRTLLEAAAMKKPVITTDTTGCRETVDNNLTGYLCQVRSIKDLAEKMERVYLLPDKQRLEMGRKARLKMEKEFNEKEVIVKMIDSIPMKTNRTNHRRITKNSAKSKTG